MDHGYYDMKIYIKNGFIVNTARDSESISLPGCIEKFCPNSYGSKINESKDLKKFMTMDDIGLSEEEANQYEAKLKLTQSDHKMARAVEDIIIILENSGIDLSSLPTEIKDNMRDRRLLRSKLSKEKQ
jgi:hypothetical protein